MTFQREEFKIAYPEICPLLVKNSLETGAFSDLELQVDTATYEKMDELGSLRVFTARDSDNVLCGYALFFVHHSIHHMQSKQALQDVIFVDKSKRGFGLEFIKWCDIQLQSEGINAVLHAVTEKLNWGVMLKRLGYELTSHTWIKRLNRETA